MIFFSPARLYHSVYPTFGEIDGQKGGNSGEIFFFFFFFFFFF